MPQEYDYLIIGAGHNGLTAAAYLAQAKKKVLVLERRPIVGGSVVTESFGRDFEADSVWTGGSLRPDIIEDLNLFKFGWKPSGEKPPFISVLSGLDHLVLNPDPAKAAESIKRFSQKDAAKWPDFVAFMNKAAKFLDTAYSTIMPRLPRNFELREGYGLFEMGVDLRRMGRRDMLRLIRMLPMTVVEFLEEWFESEELKAALASIAIHGVTLGVMSAGTGTTLLHNWLNRGGLSHSNVGKAGDITQVLANAVKGYGGEIRLNAIVKNILVDTYSCNGISLEGGEEIRAKAVLSAVDPKRTFLSLVGPVNLPPEFVWNVQSIKMRGSVAKIHLLTDGTHGVPQATLAVSPSLKYLEQAYDAAKFGEVSSKPYLEITTTGKVISIHLQFAPYALKASTWNEARASLGTLAINTLASLVGNLKSSIVDQRSITPLDLELEYGLTEGDLNHGQLMLDQLFFLRPIPGWSNHKTSIDSLYLCGSGVHGGGGISGAAGRNAARTILDSRNRGAQQEQNFEAA